MIYVVPENPVVLVDPVIPVVPVPSAFFRDFSVVGQNWQKAHFLCPSPS